jgi:hypothetical protein
MISFIAASLQRIAMAVHAQPAETGAKSRARKLPVARIVPGRRWWPRPR